MSHLTTVKTEFKLIDPLKAAIESLGRGAGVQLSLTEEYRNIRTYNGTAHADYGVRLPGKYDVGFNQRGETFEMVCDGEILYDQNNGRNDDARRLLGGNLNGLRQAYAAEVGIAAARRAGFFSARREVQADGNLLVTITR